MLSEREMTQEANENKMRSRGTRKNELDPNCEHDNDDRVSPENGRKTRTLVYEGIPTLVIEGIH
jgi:hypothetical protein